MEVKEKPFNLLQQHHPCDLYDFLFQLPLGASSRELLEQLKTSPTVHRTVLVNGEWVGKKALLSSHDTVVLMSPIEGRAAEINLLIFDTIFSVQHN